MLLSLNIKKFVPISLQGSETEEQREQNIMVQVS
jgi:hypothetical protein